MVYSEEAEGKYGKTMRTVFKRNIKGINETLGDDIMRNRYLSRISRLWIYSETSGINGTIERHIDPTTMINKTPI